ncbi:alpha/beta fold hydrolase [Bacillus sp. UNC438CL73TsuS30]|uniref:alpha/beta fold hydrolase n=1 Tax=Bacillus sp. UNC438CL73TsuS30 TaxID=1340434 RepID=UPI00047CCAE0|nr:alpha/beta fold hydrolase [Bacillus sp. UNC438CL73TsuS30]
MVIIEREYIKDIPALEVVKKEIHQESLPTIIFIHGITSAKEHNLHYAYLLAEKGFRVILPDTMHHGERQKAIEERELVTEFWNIVIKTISELKTLKEHFVQLGLADPNRIGLVGTSMGGIVTLGAITQYPWIKAAVSLMGMPAYEQFSLWQLDHLKSQGMEIPFTEEEIADQLMILRDYDLSLYPEKLEQRPLLFWHGKKDPIVPYSLTYQFYEGIMSSYSQNPERLAFITDEHAGHKVSRDGLIATVDWFAKYL